MSIFLHRFAESRRIVWQQTEIYLKIMTHIQHLTVYNQAPLLLSNCYEHAQFFVSVVRDKKKQMNETELHRLFFFFFRHTCFVSLPCRSGILLFLGFFIEDVAGGAKRIPGNENNEDGFACSRNERIHAKSC